MAVAKTISNGLLDDAKITPVVIFGGLIGATWVAAGADAVHFGTVVSKILVPALLAPIVAGVVSLVGTYLAYRITARADRGTVGSGFKVGQVVSVSMVSLAHGTNDARKTMGVITLTLITAETSSTAVILVSSQLGFPLSTSQVCSGAIFGVSAGRRLAEVRWGLAGQMVIAWVLTLPAAALVVGYGLYLIIAR